MKVKLICIGKTTDKRIEELFGEYEQRLNHYISLEIIFLELKRKPKLQEDLKKEEGSLILDKIDKSNYLVVLDELGKALSSAKFAQFMQKRLNAGQREIVFAIGGAYGFSEAVYQRADAKLQLSAMTFTHQMVRLIFIEQLYRAFTILKGEKYHH